jgi:spore maturation protein CgeB
VPILSDRWEGLDHFFEPGREILIASDTRDAIDAIGLSDADLRRIAARARERTLSEHTADHRAAELEAALDRALRSRHTAALPAMES